MKKRLKLNKVTLKNLTNEQISTIAGGFVTPTGHPFCCAPSAYDTCEGDTCSGGACNTGSTCGNTCANTCTPCTQTTSVDNGC